MHLAAIALLFSIAASASAVDERVTEEKSETVFPVEPNSLDNRQHWVFLAPVEPQLPVVNQSEWPRNAIDQFILAALESRGLKPLHDADKRTLIRRATFDLIGLPPTPQEIDAFLADDSADAFGMVVDRLLASPHYGERWGRHWLDVVRYADTAGDNSDYPVPQLYKYRNWVIHAINRDMPYDEFIRQQIAGDLMPSGNENEKNQRIIATGYLASARRFGSVVDDYPQHLTIEDTIDNLGRTFLGLTINCARCHDHKFDSITTEDYYGLYGFFHSTRYPFPGIELDKVQRDLVPLVPAEVAEAAMKERNAKKASFDADVKRIEGDKSAAEKELKTVEQEKIADVRKLIEDLEKSIKDAKKKREDFEKVPLPFDTAYAVAEATKIENVRIQMKGDPKKLGDEVPRRFPKVFGDRSLPADERTSGRLQLANWIADPQNPLTARVMVNRLWQHHFGTGIVSTPSDFGRQGHAPTHPELLDYLARRFVESGWSIKAMHRMIMLSRTYQLSSSDDAANAAIDPSNECLWRFNRRRLDAESIRDAMLAVSGQLDPGAPGPHPFPDQRTWDFTQHKPFKAVYESNHRSVYLMTQRIQRHPYLAIFDGPDTNASTAQRVTSTTPLQALFLMNDPFAHEQARQFAARLVASRSNDPARIELAYELAFGRPPSADERAAVESYLKQIREKLTAASLPGEQVPQAAWESYVRAIFRMNEFLYIE